MRTIVINCACFSFEHMLTATMDDERIVYLSIHLTQHSFFTRLAYLFGFRKRATGAFEEAVLTPDSLPQLREIVKYLEGETE